MPGDSLSISAEITDNVKVENAYLVYKKVSDTEWITVPMRNIEGSLYKGVISSYEIADEDLEYYITVL